VLRFESSTASSARDAFGISSPRLDGPACCRAFLRSAAARGRHAAGGEVVLLAVVAVMMNNGDVGDSVDGW
jgi:hypothetical protein